MELKHRETTQNIIFAWPDFSNYNTQRYLQEDASEGQKRVWCLLVEAGDSRVNKYLLVS